MSRISRDRISFSSSTTPTYVEQAMHASVRKVSLSRKSFTTPSKKSQEEESPVKPDSTTESRKVMHNFQEGDDVFFEDAEGQSVLGTVAKVSANTCLVSFDDGTEQWAACKRLRKLGSSDEDLSNEIEAVETAARCVEKVLKKTEKIKATCIGNKCGEEMSPSKAKGSRVQFRCLNSDGGLLSQDQDFVTLTQTKVLENYVKQTRTVTNASASGKLAEHLNGEGPRSLTSPTSKVASKSPVSKSYPKSGGLMPKSGIQGKRVGNEITIMNYFKPTSDTSVQSTIISETEECFHCKGATVQFQRVRCNMCSRFCHLFCLQLQPTPMNGDRFWDVMCATCGTQNGAGGSHINRVFSARRNVSSWADIAQLLINCMSAKSRENSFALKSQILPFMKKYNDVLHLPKMYKQSPDQQREMSLLAALTASTWRFVKRYHQNGSEPLWSLAPEFDQEVPSKKKCNDNVRGSSGKPLSSKIVQGSPKTQAFCGPAVSPSQTNSVIANSLPKSTAAMSPDSQINFSSSSAASRLMQSSPRRGLSIIPIPKPGSDEYSSGAAGYSADDMKISLTSPKVLPKEVLLRQPVVTNIILSPTNTSSVYGLAAAPKTCRTVTSESPRRPIGVPDTPKTLTPGKSPVYQMLNGHATPMRNLEQRLESASVSNNAEPSLRKRSVPMDFNETGGNIKRPRLLDSVPSGISPNKSDVHAGRKPKLLRSSLKKNKISTTPTQQAANALKVKATKGKLGKKSSVSPSSIISNDVDEDPELELMDAHNKPSGHHSARRTRRLARANHMKASTAVAAIVPTDEIEDPEEEAHKQWQEGLLDAILYGGLRPRCLPRTLVKRSAACLFDDIEPPEGESTGSDTESINSAVENTKSGVVTQKVVPWKSLNDPSSYSIAASRVGSSGQTEYFVVWHETRETATPSGFFAEMERILFPDGVPPQHPFGIDEIEEDGDETMDIDGDDTLDKVTETVVPLKAANGSVSTSALAQKLTSNYKVDSKNASVVLRSNSLALVPGGDGSSHIFDIGVD